MAKGVRMEDFEAAMERTRKLQEKFPRAVSAHYDRAHDRVVVELSSRLAVSFRPGDAEGLEHAKTADLAEIELSPSGFGIHFPRLDADFYVPALLEGFLGSRKWMAARMGEAGGEVAQPGEEGGSASEWVEGGKAAAKGNCGRLAARSRGNPRKSQDKPVSDWQIEGPILSMLTRNTNGRKSSNLSYSSGPELNKRFPTE